MVIGWLVPYNNEELLSGSHNASASPFVIAIENAGIKVLPSIINSVILISGSSSFAHVLLILSHDIFTSMPSQHSPLATLSYTHLRACFTASLLPNKRPGLCVRRLTLGCRSMVHTFSSLMNPNYIKLDEKPWPYHQYLPSFPT
jgi:hypothetical protein